jgi:hypothetical protein
VTTFSFAPATRERSFARIGLQGPAGSGKSLTALKIAQRLADGGQIGVVDTERGSALTYAPVPGRPDLGGIPFLHLPLDNYDPRNLIEATRAAAAAKIRVFVVDSWSHFYNGKGGLLQIVDAAGNAPGSGGSFGGWRTGTPIEQNMLEALLNYPGHVICTMRTKGDYSIEGKKVTKLGVKAVQREGAEYELGLIVDMVEGTGTVTKTRYAQLEGLTMHHPGAELAEVILEQLGQGVDPVEAVIAELRAKGLTYQGALAIYQRAERMGHLGLESAHLVTGEVMPLGDVIKAVGGALRPAAPSPARQALDEYADRMAGQDDASGREAGVTGYAGPIHGSHVPDEQPPPPAADLRATKGAITPQMMRRIFAQLKAVGCPDDRSERLAVVGLLLGKPVGSMNELAFRDGSELIDTLSGFEGEGGHDRFAQTITKLRADAA